MPALVPSAGVTMDERIRNLMQERGHNHLLMNVDDPDLGESSLTAWTFCSASGKRWRRHRAHRGEESEAHGAHGSLPGAQRARALSGIPHPGGREKLGRLSSAVADEFEAAGGAIRQPRANDGGELKSRAAEVNFLENIFEAWRPRRSAWSWKRCGPSGASPRRPRRCSNASRRRAPFSPPRACIKAIAARCWRRTASIGSRWTWPRWPRESWWCRSTRGKRPRSLPR